MADMMKGSIKSTYCSFSKKCEFLIPVSSKHGSHRQWMYTHLAEVACHSNLMPDIVIKLPTGRFHQGLERTRAQVDDQPQSSIPQGQVDIVSRLPCVKQQAVPLQGTERQRDLIQTALNGCLGQVVAEELIAFEGGH